MMANSGYQLWLVTRDADGESVPYQLIGCVSTKELADELLRATINAGYDAVVKEF